MRIKDGHSPKGRMVPTHQSWNVESLIGAWPFGVTVDGGGWGNGDGHANLFTNKTRIHRRRERSFRDLACSVCDTVFRSAARNAKYCGSRCYRQATLTRKKTQRAA